MAMKHASFDVPAHTMHRSRAGYPRASARVSALHLKRENLIRPVIWTLACVGALAAMTALAPRAHAQVFSSQPYVAAPDPAVEQLRIRLEALEDDLRKAIDQSETLGAQLGDARRIAEQADAGRRRAEAEIELLKDRVETLEDELQNGAVPRAAEAAPAPVAPTNNSRSAIAAAPPPPPAPAAPAVDTAALPQDEEGLFTESHALLIGGNFPGAEQAFSAYLSKYPKGKKVADAQYYLGEALLYQDNFPDAAQAYGKLIKDYPNSANAPTGLVKLARAMRLMDKRTEACKALDLMGKQFPKASAVAKQMAAQERQLAKCS
jgi:tol-pal system protein YbgF